MASNIVFKIDVKGKADSELRKIEQSFRRLEKQSGQFGNTVNSYLLITRLLVVF